MLISANVFSLSFPGLNSLQSAFLFILIFPAHSIPLRYPPPLGFWPLWTTYLPPHCSIYSGFHTFIMPSPHPLFKKSMLKYSLYLKNHFHDDEIITKWVKITFSCVHSLYFVCTSSLLFFPTLEFPVMVENASQDLVSSSFSVLELLIF